MSTPENVAQIEELAASQEDMPGTHLSQRKISRHLNIKRASVKHILSNKIKFKALRESKQAGKPRMRAGITSWKKRLRHVIAADGGSSEHLRL